MENIIKNKTVLLLFLTIMLQKNASMNTISFKDFKNIEKKDIMYMSIITIFMFVFRSLFQQLKTLQNQLNQEITNREKKNQDLKKKIQIIKRIKTKINNYKKEIERTKNDIIKNIQEEKKSWDMDLKIQKAWYDEVTQQVDQKTELLNDKLKKINECKIDATLEEIKNTIENYKGYISELTGLHESKKKDLDIAIKDYKKELQKTETNLLNLIKELKKKHQELTTINSNLMNDNQKLIAALYNPITLNPLNISTIKIIKNLTSLPNNNYFT
jgi:DNA repair exonuclease SbcCD ATPase subunit